MDHADAAELGRRHVIVVTGGAGFIGSNVASALAARGVGVVVVDRLGDDDVKWRNLARAPLERILAPEALDGWLAHHGHEVEAVVHMGAISSTTVVDADLVVRTNLDLTRSLWDWCAARHRPFLWASSAATYGDGAQGFDDDDTPAALARLRPLNLYGWSKHAFDVWAGRAVAAGRPAPPRWAGLKFFNVYGPNEYHKGEMRSLVAKAWPQYSRGEPVRLFKSHHADYADGGQLRDFVHVDDAVAVVLWWLDHRGASGLYNVGTGRARSFADLIGAAFAACGHAPAIDYVDMPEAIRERYQYYTQADPSRLRSAGFDRAFTPLEAGVGDYVQRFLSQADRHA